MVVWLYGMYGCMYPTFMPGAKRRVRIMADVRLVSSIAWRSSKDTVSVLAIPRAHPALFTRISTSRKSSGSSCGRAIKASRQRTSSGTQCTVQVG